MTTTVLPELGPTSKRLLRFLREEGALEKFVTNCSNLPKLIDNLDGDFPDRYWRAWRGGFNFFRSPEGTRYWRNLAEKAKRAGVYSEAGDV